MERADQEVRQALEADSRVAHVASAEILGYAASESQNEDKPYIYLLGADATFFDVMPVRAVGRLPEQEGEILVPVHYLSVGNEGASLQIGDTVELALGERMVDGYPLNQSNPLCDDEALQVRETRTYRVVGFYERPDFEDYSAPGYTFLTVPESGGPQNYTLYYKTADAGDMNAVIAAHDLPEDQNWSLLAAEGVFRYDNFGRVFFGLATILIFLIVLGSVSLIYSAFSISVSERTRQFGLLRSVGATRSQLRRSVLYEAAVISVIGIPLGILCGLGGMAVTLHFIGGLFQGVLAAEVPMRFRVSWASVGGSRDHCSGDGADFCVDSCQPGHPRHRAGGHSTKSGYPHPGKDVRVSRLTGRLFGLEGILAKKYFRRNRRRYRATIVSLVLSLVLFISASSFCMYLTGTVDETLSVSNYDVLCFLDGEADPQAVFSALSEAKGVQQGAYWKEDRGYLLLEQDQLNETYLRYGEVAAKTFWQAYADPAYTGAVAIPVERYYVDETSYRQFLTAQGLDAGQYLDASHPLPLVYNEGNDVLYLQGAEGHYERQVYTYQILKRGTRTAALRQPQAVEGYDYGYTGNVSDSQPDARADSCPGLLLQRGGRRNQPPHPNGSHRAGRHGAGAAAGRFNPRGRGMHPDLSLCLCPGR
ncbi:MAG: ABC transporter permease [Oscillospiraceae bacterium]